jgi:hypothetical protein
MFSQSLVEVSIDRRLFQQALWRLHVALWAFEPIRGLRTKSAISEHFVHNILIYIDSPILC